MYGRQKHSLLWFVTLTDVSNKSQGMEKEKLDREREGRQKEEERERVRERRYDENMNNIILLRYSTMGQ